MCFTATECRKSEFFVLRKPLKGSYFGSVLFQCNKFSVFQSCLTKVFWTTRISLDVPFRKSMYTQTENMSAKSSCYLTNFKHSLHLLMKTGTNWGRNPCHRNFSVIFFFNKDLGYFFCFSGETFNLSLIYPQTSFKGIPKNEIPKWIYQSTVCRV